MKKKKLAELMAQLKGMAPQIEANEEGALEKAQELETQIESLKAEIAQDEQKAAMLKRIGSIETVSEQKEKMSDLELFCKKAAEVDRSVKGWSASQHIKAATDVVTGVQLADIDRSVAPQPTRRAARDLFTNATISGNAITYFLQGAYEGTPAVTAENAKKPQNSTSFEPKTLALSKIAAFIKETDEIVTDAPFLASEVRNSLLYHLGVVEDSTLIGAVAGTSGIQAGTYELEPFPVQVLFRAGKT